MIRIINGTLKGRRILAPTNLPARPTTDFAKEGLFNLLTNRIDFETCRVLDLFAGTGNISYELASRGCQDIVCVDADASCVRFIQEMVTKFNLPAIKTIRQDAFAFLSRPSPMPWSLIFADPPFELDKKVEIPHLVFQNQILAPDGLLVIEHPINTQFSDTSHLLETRKYGKVHFSFFGNRD